MSRPQTLEEAIDLWAERPKPLPGVVSYYDHATSFHPDRIRMSFSDGSTAVYEIRHDQPHPLVLKNIEIMKETKQNIKQGYVNNPRRRRK